MPILPDPRPYSRLAVDHPFAERLSAAWEARAAGRDSRPWHGLVRGLLRALERGEGGLVSEALATAGAEQGALLGRAVDDAIDAVGTDEDLPLVTRVFLLPVLFVTAGAAPAVVAGALPDVAELGATLRAAGALGRVESLAWSNALGTLEAAAAVPPERLHALGRHGGGDGGADLLAPAPLQIDDAAEQVHVRLITGVCVTGVDAPTVMETAGQVGRWGMAVSRLLAEQLAVPGLSLLALPRAPASWHAALAQASFAREEIAFQLFATGAIRRIRTATGDPLASVSACTDGSVRIELRSPFDDMEVHSHAWRLGPADDMARVEFAITDLLRECRIADVAIAPDVTEPMMVGAPSVRGSLLS